MGGVILAASSTRPKDLAPEIGRAPFIAGDMTLPVEARLQVLHLAFFAPGHDPRPWLDGWYPETLAAQHEAVEATDLEPYWSGGAVPLLEINPRCDPFKPQKHWSDLHDELGDRVTMTVIDDASHALFPEQSDQVAEAVWKWIEHF